MSSKMRAGLIAGGFGIAFDVVLLLFPSLLSSTSVLSGLLFTFLSLFATLGLGILSGALAAIWLDLDDYGRQFSAGAFAGAVAALVEEVGVLGLVFILAEIHRANPNNPSPQVPLSSLPLGGQILSVTVTVIIYALFFLLGILINMGISGLTTTVVAYGKGTRVLQAMLEAEEAPAGEQEEPLDPSLLPYQGPAYSPFVNEQPPMLSPWQRRRLEKEGRLVNEDSSSGGAGGPNSRQQGPVYRVTPPPKWRGPKPH